MIVDLLEVFAGTARASELAPRFGLCACQPFDLIYEIDIKTSQDQRRRKSWCECSPLTETTTSFNFGSMALRPLEHLQPEHELCAQNG